MLRRVGSYFIVSAQEDSLTRLDLPDFRIVSHSLKTSLLIAACVWSQCVVPTQQNSTICFGLFDFWTSISTSFTNIRMLPAQ